MVDFASHTFSARGILSLCWRGDELVDWVGGGRRFALDGTEHRASVYYPYRFDAATASRDGRFAVIYENRGTKGLLLEDGKIVRELNRSYYCADAYEYPVALFNDVNGRLLLAHCPDEYCRLEIEDVNTGRALTTSSDRKPSDFFHSRLLVSPNGKRLLSAGWVWHPWSGVLTFDLSEVIQEPARLDKGEHAKPHSGYEEGSACWLDDDTLIIGGNGDEEDLDGGEESLGPNLLPRGLAVYDLVRACCVRAFALDEPPGTMWAIGKHHVLSLYRNPKLIDLRDGKVVQVWDQLGSGLQVTSITRGTAPEKTPPPMAFDTQKKRFAIAVGDAITILQFADLVE